MMWCGKPLEDLKRDELIQAVKWLVAQVDDSRQFNARVLETWTESINARARMRADRL